MTSKVIKSPVVVSPDEAAALAEATEQAAADAHRAGFEEGRREGGAELAAEVARLTDAIEQLRDRVIADAVASVRLDADTLVRLATDLAAWFVDAAVTADVDRFVDTIRDAVADLVEEGAVVVHVPPVVAELLQLPDGATVRPDPTLGPADFRVATSSTVVERIWASTVPDLAPDLASVVRLADRER